MKRHANRQQHEQVLGTVRRVGCGGKRAYDSFTVAERMARNTRRDTEDAVAPYHCRFCGKFHVGRPK